jgi:hypothetical protein
VKALGWKMLGQNLIQTSDGERIQLRDGQAISRSQDSIDVLRKAYTRTKVDAVKALCLAHGATVTTSGKKTTITLGARKI